jgi:hypothetical protein
VFVFTLKSSAAVIKLSCVNAANEREITNIHCK